jgi:hypothetical protein
MFIFLRLVLAHLIGDFPLQINAVYSAKVKHFAGKALHVILIGIPMILLTWPFWNSPFLWLVIGINVVGHYLQDWAKLVLVQRIKNPNNFFVFMADQVLHILSAGLIGLTPLAKETPVPSSDHFLSRLYYNDAIVILLISFLTVSFAGIFILATFKGTFLSKKFYTPYLDFLERIYGMIERSLMFGLLCLSFYTIFALPLFLVPKFLYANFQMKRLKGSSFSAFLIDTGLGILLAVLTYGMYLALI